MLGIDGDHPPTGELIEIDAVTTPVETHLKTLMNKAFAFQPLADARLGHQVHGALFQHAGADGRLDCLARAALDDDQLNAPQMKEV